MAKREADATAEVIATFRPETASPEEVERLIDLRVAKIDEQIQDHVAAAEELRAERKRWVGVTGGRSRMIDSKEVGG